jgi:hypothetical protein
MDIDRDQLGIVLDALPPIFRDCVGDEHVGSGAGLFFGYPFAIGDHVYATDGRIVVRTGADPDVADLLPAAPEGRRFPRADRPDKDGSDRWAPDREAGPTPPPALDALPKCPECGGRGYFAVASPCPACGGEGDEPCPHCGEPSPCRRCSGRGRIPAGTCVACFGSGIDEDSPGFAEVGGGIVLGTGHLAILRRHGAVLYLPRTAERGGRPMPVRFVVPGSPGVEGLVMPMTPPSPPAPAGIVAPGPRP